MKVKAEGKKIGGRTFVQQISAHSTLMARLALRMRLPVIVASTLLSLPVCAQMQMVPVITPHFEPIPRAKNRHTDAAAPAHMERTGDAPPSSAKLALPGAADLADTAPAAAALYSSVPYSQPVSNPATHNFGGLVATPTYQATPLPLTGSYSVSVTLAADFNKDGAPDVATLDGRGNVNVLLNDGQGHFAVPITTSLSTTLHYIAAQAVDLDGDGYPDIVAKSWVNSVSKTQTLYFFHNKHDGTFSAAGSMTVALSSYIDIGSFVVNDVNGDGIPDIVNVSSVYTSAPSPTSTLTVQTFLGKGSGTFNLTNVPTVTMTYAGYNVGLPNGGALLQKLGGKLNLVFEAQAYDDAHSGTLAGVSILALPGNGDGTFNVAAKTETDFDASYGYVTDYQGGLGLTDLNGDGIPDITLNFNDDYVYSALGRADGTFGTPQTAISTFALNPAGWAVVDVNGDGIPDFVDQDQFYTAVFFGQGDGTFNSTQTVYLSNEAAAPFSLNTPGANLVTADFNNDGRLDFALVDSGAADYDRAWVFMNHGDGTFAATTSPVPVADPNTFPQAIDPLLALDLNGDGLTDLLMIDEMGNAPYPLLAALSDGKGNFSYKTALAGGAGGFTIRSVVPVTVDLNNDGRTDVLMQAQLANGTSQLVAALSKGDGTLMTPVAIGQGTTTTTNPFGGVSVADVNGDGKLDVVAVSVNLKNSSTGAQYSTSGIYVALGRGDGTFQPMQFTPTGTSLISAALADVNGDGKPDLIFADAGSTTGAAQVSVIYGTGSGTFSPAKAVIFQSGSVVYQILTGDLNSDGKADVVLLSQGSLTAGVSNSATAGAYVYLSTSSGLAQPTFQSAGMYEPGRRATMATLADINGDSVPDLIYSAYSTLTSAVDYYGVQVLLGNGDGTFGQPSGYIAGTASTVLVGDFLADGALDLVTQSSYSVPGLFLNQGGTAISLKASATSILAGQNEVIQASVLPTAAYRPAPTGTITYTENGTVVGAASVAAGQATFSTSNSAVGTHSISAAYSGDANFNPQMNAGTVSFTVTAPPTVPASFTMQASTTSLELARGQSGSAALTVTANSTFSGTVTFAVSGPLNGLMAQVAPTTVTLSPGQTVTVSMTVGTVQNAALEKWNPWNELGGGISFACLLGLVLPFRRKRMPRLLSLLLLVVSTLGVVGLAGCGSSYKTAVKGTSNLVITATPSMSGVNSQSTTLSVTVN